MNNKRNLVLGAILVVLVLIAYVAYPTKQSPTAGGEIHNVAESFDEGIRVDGTERISGTGGASFTTGSFSGLETTNAGTLNSYTNSTSTTATTYTLLQSDIANYDSVLMTPNTGALTLTLPATSTITTFIPTAGDMVRQCWSNATSTAAATITFAAGTGIDIATSSSTPTDLTFSANNAACLEYVRKKNTDIHVLMTEFMDAD